MKISEKSLCLTFRNIEQYFPELTLKIKSSLADIICSNRNFLENAFIDFFYNLSIVEATMSSPRSRRRISEIISGGKLFGLM